MTNLGKWEEGVFKFPIRVYYEDTDLAGIVYHANYLRYAERARTEFVRSLGFDATGLKESDGVYFVVRHCDIKFLAPAKVDDVLYVNCKVLKFPATNITVEQDIYCNGEKITEMQLHLVCMHEDGKIARIPKAMRDAYEELAADCSSSVA